MRFLLNYRFNLLDIFAFILVANITQHSWLVAVIFGAFAAAVTISLERKFGITRGDV